MTPTRHFRRTRGGRKCRVDAVSRDAIAGSASYAVT
jgi:hypothetical protein